MVVQASSVAILKVPSHVDPPIHPTFFKQRAQAFGTDGLILEGESTGLSLQLTSAPESNVTVAVSVSDPGQAAVDVAALVFTPGTWFVPQVVVLSVVADGIEDADPISPFSVSFVVASGDPVYHPGLTASQLLWAVDVDSSESLLFGVDRSGVPEDGSEAALVVVSLVGAILPGESLTVEAVATEGAQAVVDPASVTFTEVNWATPKTFSVVGLDDEVDDGDAPFGVSFVTSDGAHTAAFDFVNVNDDFAGLVATPPGGPGTAVVVDELGAVSEVSVRLTSRPTATVFVDVSVEPADEALAFPSSLTFVPDAWLSEKYVVVQGLRDAIDDGDVDFSVRFGPMRSLDPRYDGLLVETDGVNQGIAFPAISSFFPLVSPLAGGINVTITGQNFLPGAVVYVGDILLSPGMVGGWGLGVGGWGCHHLFSFFSSFLFSIHLFFLN